MIPSVSLQKLSHYLCVLVCDVRAPQIGSMSRTEGMVSPLAVGSPGGGKVSRVKKKTHKTSLNFHLAGGYPLEHQRQERGRVVMGAEAT